MHWGLNSRNPIYELCKDFGKLINLICSQCCIRWAFNLIVFISSLFIKVNHSDCSSWLCGLQNLWGTLFNTSGSHKRVNLSWDGFSSRWAVSVLPGKRGKEEVAMATLPPAVTCLPLAPWSHLWLFAASLHLVLWWFCWKTSISSFWQKHTIVNNGFA